MVTPRLELQEFSILQEVKLLRNDHKQHWENEPISALFKRIQDELDELNQAILDEDWHNAMYECADIANFSMMIWDNIRKKYGQNNRY